MIVLCIKSLAWYGGIGGMESPPEIDGPTLGVSATLVLLLHCADIYRNKNIGTLPGSRLMGTASTFVVVSESGVIPPTLNYLPYTQCIVRPKFALTELETVPWISKCRESCLSGMLVSFVSETSWLALDSCLTLLSMCTFRSDRSLVASGRRDPLKPTVSSNSNVNRQANLLLSSFLTGVSLRDLDTSRRQVVLFPVPSSPLRFDCSAFH